MILSRPTCLVDAEDRIKLTDFGIAKLFGSSDMTLSGNVLGTVDYMAPEQASGQATSPRCDLFSLGCVMYALLAGRPPFRGKSIPEVLHKVRYEQHRSVNQSIHDVPDDLSQVIDELLEKDPDDRIRTALSLSHRLRAIQQALSISTTDKEDFTNDEDANVPINSSPTNLIVNPPPDIAERPTVFLDEEPAQKPAATSAKKSKEKKAKQDHFTRIERESKKHADIGRSNEFSSAIPLLLMLLTVLGGLLGGIWYSSRPLPADDLHEKISNASNDLSSAALARDVERFIKLYPEDSRMPSIKDIQEDVAIYKMQKMFEIRARARPETGTLSPIEVHCNEAFRAYRDGDIEHALDILRGIQQLYGSEQRSDIRVRRAMELVARLLPQWQEELDKKVVGLRADAVAHLKLARELQELSPERTREIWQGIITLYGDRPWAQEYFDEATRQIAAFPPAEPVVDALAEDEMIRKEMDNDPVESMTNEEVDSDKTSQEANATDVDGVSTNADI